MAEKALVPLSSLKSPNTSSILSLSRPQTKNTTHNVTNKKTKENGHSQKDLPNSHVNLIKLTRKLAEDAESGKLKGLGGFADFGEEGYMFGLEGSYLTDPTASVLPLKRLEWRIMDQIESED